MKFYQELVLRLVNIFHILLWSNNFLFTLLIWVISIDFKNYFTIYFYVYVCFPFTFICASRACGAPAGQKRACRSPWELHKVVRALRAQEIRSRSSELRASTLIYWGIFPALLSSYLKCWNNFTVLPGCLVSMVHHLNIVGYMFYNILVGITCLFMLSSVPHVWQVFDNWIVCPAPSL